MSYESSMSYESCMPMKVIYLMRAACLWELYIYESCTPVRATPVRAVHL